MANPVSEIHEPPPVVSQRNHFHSVACMVDMNMRQIPEHLRISGLREWLLSFTESVIQDVRWAFAKGAERGIEQTAELLCDPDYYVTLKERRRRERERHDAYEKQQEEERLERKLAPTAEQIEHEMADLETWIERDAAHIVRMRDRLVSLRAMVPKHVRITDVKKDWAIKTSRPTLPTAKPFVRPLQPLDPPEEKP